MKAIVAHTKSSVGSGRLPDCVEKIECLVRKERTLVFGKVFIPNGKWSILLSYTSDEFE